MKKEIELDSEKFKEIYSDEKLRNAVAFAHGCSDKYGNHKYYKALVYPLEYIVTESQIQEAKKEYERAKKEKAENIKPGQLIFVGMGMNFQPRFEGDLCNHRIRTEFKNRDGKRYFIEVGTGRGNDITCMFSIDRDLEDECDKIKENLFSKMEKLKKYSPEWWALRKEYNSIQQPYYNFKNLQHTDLGLYSKENLLKIVNETFDCSYTEIEVDEYTLCCDDFICFCHKG